MRYSSKILETGDVSIPPCIIFCILRFKEELNNLLV